MEKVAAVSEPLVSSSGARKQLMEKVAAVSGPLVSSSGARKQLMEKVAAVSGLSSHQVEHANN